MKQITTKELIEGAKFTEQELDFINKISKKAFSEEHRVYVLLAICSSIIGNVVHMSEGVLSVDTVVKVVKMGVETYENN